MIKYGNFTVELSNNLIKKIYYKDILVNSFQSTIFDIRTQNESLMNGNASIYKNGIVYKSDNGVVEIIFSNDSFKINVECDEDVIMFCDIGINNDGEISTNEFYNSQYIDVSKDGNIFIYKHNIKGNKLTITSQNEIKSYATDLSCLVGNNYKKLLKYGFESNFVLPSKIVQYEEMCYGAITKGTNSFIFSFENNFDTYELLELTDSSSVKRESIDAIYGNDFNTIVDGNNIEENNGVIYSYFNDDNSHIVTSQKEMQSLRQTGYILLSHSSYDFNDNVMAVTCYMNGIFASHIVSNNTNVNKLTSNVCDYQNLDITRGLRIFLNNRLLTVPTYFEMNINFCKWVYELEDDCIEIITSTSYDKNKVQIEFKSTNTYDIMITNDIVLDDYKISDNCIYNNSIGYYYTNANSKLKDNKIVTNINSNAFSLVFSSTDDIDNFNYKRELSSFENMYDDLLQNKSYSYNDYNFDLILRLYTHNMLIHYLSPHGLEQNSGAAWGVRDVMQGPFEYFLSLGHYDIAKKIIARTFNAQYKKGYFPQWFMYDEHFGICQEHHHGDVILWPLRAVGLYIKYTNDLTILEQEICFMDSDEKCSIKEHIDIAIKHIEDNLYPSTSLIKYNGGDWNDSLQPADSNLAQHLVSGWTVGLMYETFDLLNKLEHYDFNDLLSNIKQDFSKYFIEDNVIAGFVNMKTNQKLMHPNSNDAINYRLLPMQKSIISGITDSSLNDYTLDVIYNNLVANDGARLMDKPPIYKNGETGPFLRAQSAANFGREIGLNYIHAHIRFIEALIKMDKKELAFKEILKIIPIDIDKNVKNVGILQRNVYFSSFDANFNNRYEVNESYDKVKQGLINVSGGWRIYSSGPGILIRLIVENFS